MKYNSIHNLIQLSAYVGFMNGQHANACTSGYDIAECLCSNAQEWRAAFQELQDMQMRFLCSCPKHITGRLEMRKN